MADAPAQARPFRKDHKAPPRLIPRQTILNGCCGVSAVLFVLVGNVLILAPESWPNDRFAGALVMLGGAMFAPPILRRVRRILPFSRHPAVPVIFWFVLIPLATMAAIPFKPSEKEQARLEAAAILKAGPLLAKGDPYSARAVLRKFPSRADNGPKLAFVYRQIDAAIAARSVPSKPEKAAPATLQHAATAHPPTRPAMPAAAQFQDPASQYAERLTTYWLPEAQGLPNSPPSDDEQFGKLLSQIDGLVINVQDGDRLTLSKPQREVRQRLIRAISAKQVSLLPAMRRRYAGELRAKLFRDDVDVSIGGRDGTTLHFTGGMFVKNSNIEDAQQSVETVLRSLRFRRVEYHWSRFLADGYSYTLRTPSDAAVGRWIGDTFETASGDSALRK